MNRKPSISNPGIDNINSSELMGDQNLSRMLQIANFIAQSTTALLYSSQGELLSVLLPVDLTDISTEAHYSLYKQTNQSRELIEIADVSNILITQKQKKVATFFIGIPLIEANRQSLGALCLFGFGENILSPEQKRALNLISEQIVSYIEEKGKKSNSGIKRLLEKKFASLSYNYNAFLNSTDYAVILVDLTGKIKVFNSGAEKMLGYSSNEIIDQKDIFFLHDSSELASKMPFEKQGKSPVFGHYVAKPSIGITEVGNWHFVKKDGKRIIVQLSVSPIRNEEKNIISYLGIAEDITEKKKTEEELRISEERHRFFFENSQGLMCSHDSKGKLISLNEAGASILGYKPEDLIGLKLYDLVPKTLKPRLLEYLKTIFEKGFATGLVKLRHKEGAVKVLYYKNVKIGNGDNSYVIGNAIDVSSRIELENDLKKAKFFAEKMSHAKDQFLANMSHEIRTPMNAIIGFTDVLIETKLDSNQKEYIGAIKTAGENLLGIINDILDFSKIESGKLGFENAPFSLKEAIVSTCGILKVKSKEKGIELKILLDPFLPDYVFGDRLRINQVLLNLIGNAIKFTEKGEVIVSVNLNKEELDACIVHFSIKDTGIGISQDHITTIFERFTQASNETTRKYGGTGLGLSISRNLIEMQGGVLKVESTLGVGSEFMFSLKFKKTDFGKDLTEKHEVLIQPVSKRLKILLIEDNELNQKLAKKVISDFNFDLDIAENGLLGVEKLAVANYDVVLMDLQMPVMDGYEATYEIRNKLKLKVPIIAMTAHSLAGEKDKCIEMGMNDYIAKPFKAKDLYYKINQFNDTTHFDPEKTGTAEDSLPDMKYAINLDYLKNLSGGDVQFEKSIINLFLLNIPKEMEAIDLAFKEGDRTGINKCCHKIKPNVMVFNLGFIEEKISTIEDSNSDISEMRSLWNETSELLKQTIKALKEIMIRNYGE